MNYAHGNMLTEEELDLIAASHGTLSITPSTDMLMQFGTFPGTAPRSNGESFRVWGSTPSAGRDRPVLRDAPGARSGAFPGQRPSTGPG